MAASPVRDGARQGTLRASDAGVREVAQHWEQLVEYLALGLSQELGREVARAVAYMASSESGLMTGSVIDFDQTIRGTYESGPQPSETLAQKFAST